MIMITIIITIYHHHRLPLLYNYFMVSVFGWPDPNTGFNQSEHALYTCYFITPFTIITITTITTIITIITTTIETSVDFLNSLALQRHLLICC
jgi:hypothetical protein